jgi:hypothetical protein
MGSDWPAGSGLACFFSFIHEHLDGLGHGFEAVLGEQLDGFVGGGRLELVGHGFDLLFSVLTKKKPILAHFFKQTDRPSTFFVRCAHELERNWRAMNL